MMLSRFSKIFKAEKYGSIKGKVINFYGHPIDDAEVFAKVENEILTKGKSDGNGDFLLENIPVGTRKILVEAVKGKRDADHRDLTHRGSFGNGKDVDDLIKVVRRRPNVECVQVPLIGVPGPKVKDFLLEVVPGEKTEKDKLERKYSVLKTTDKEIKLPFIVNIKPFPDIRQGKFSIFLKISNLMNDKDSPMDQEIVKNMNPKLLLGDKEYDWDNIPILPLNRLQNMYVRPSNIKKNDKPIKVTVEVSIFQQLEKRKYVNFSSGYYKVV